MVDVFEKIEKLHHASEFVSLSTIVKGVKLPVLQQSAAEVSLLNGQSPMGGRWGFVHDDAPLPLHRLLFTDKASRLVELDRAFLSRWPAAAVPSALVPLRVVHLHSLFLLSPWTLFPLVPRGGIEV